MWKIEVSQVESDKSLFLDEVDQSSIELATSNSILRPVEPQTENKCHSDKYGILVTRISPS